MTFMIQKDCVKQFAQSFFVRYFSLHLSIAIKYAGRTIPDMIMVFRGLRYSSQKNMLCMSR